MKLELLNPFEDEKLEEKENQTRNQLPYSENIRLYNNRVFPIRINQSKPITTSHQCSEDAVGRNDLASCC